jgi:hypothetical protein
VSSRTFPEILLLAMLVTVSAGATAQPTPAANAAFESYVQSLETRLMQQHQSPNGFVVSGDTAADTQARVRKGEMVVEGLTPAHGGNPDGAMLHHWRATAFAPGARAADLEQLLMDFATYPQVFAPQVLRGKVLSRQGDHMQAVMRVRQHHVLTVVMDTTYDIMFGRLSPRDGYSVSRSTQVSEIESPGTAREHAMSAREEHGFLWRLNTYWSWAEADGGLYMQIESVSLTRDIPHGLGWAVRPFVQSIPRESLEFTLRAAGNALRKPSHEVVNKEKEKR